MLDQYEFEINVTQQPDTKKACKCANTTKPE